MTLLDRIGDVGFYREEGVPRPSLESLVQEQSRFADQLEGCRTVDDLLDATAARVRSAGYLHGMAAWDTPPGVISPGPAVRVWGDVVESNVVGRMLQPSGFDPSKPYDLDVLLRSQAVIGLDEVADFYCAQLSVERDVVVEFIEGIGVNDWLGLWVETGLEWGVLVYLLGSRRGSFGDGDRCWLASLIEPLRAAAVRVGRAGPSASVLKCLSPRELHVADLLAQAKSNDEIAGLLFVSLHTVKKHISRALDKTGLPNRTALALAASARNTSPMSAEMFRDGPVWSDEAP